MTYLTKKCSGCKKPAPPISLGGLFDVGILISNTVGMFTGANAANKADPAAAAAAYLMGYSGSSAFPTVAVNNDGSLSTAAFDARDDAQAWLEANNADTSVLYSAYRASGQIISGALKHSEVIEVTGTAPKAKSSSKLPLLLGLGVVGYLVWKGKKGAR